MHPPSLLLLILTTKCVVSSLLLDPTKCNNNPPPKYPSFVPIFLKKCSLCVLQWVQCFWGTSWNAYYLNLLLIWILPYGGGERERESHHLCNEQLVCTSTSLIKKAWQQSLNIVFTLPSGPPTTTLKSSYQDTDGPQKKKKTQNKTKQNKRKKRKEMI